MIAYILLFLFSVFISSVSQIILKSSANNEHINVFGEYFNAKVLIAYGVFFLSSLLTILAYRKVPLSMGVVLEATGYIWVTLLGYIILKEKINKRKCLGLVIIILGILVSNLG